MDEFNEKPCGKFHTHIAHTWEDNFKKFRCHGAMDGKLKYHPLTARGELLAYNAGVMSLREFADRIHDRVKWVQENCPELMVRPIMVRRDQYSFPVKDVFVEEFLWIDL